MRNLERSSHGEAESHGAAGTDYIRTPAHETRPGLRVEISSSSEPNSPVDRKALDIFQATFTRSRPTRISL